MIYSQQKIFCKFVYILHANNKQLKMGKYFSKNILFNAPFVKVKYFSENVFQFFGVCLYVKCNQTCKIFSIDHKIIYKKLENVLPL